MEWCDVPSVLLDNALQQDGGQFKESSSLGIQPSHWSPCNDNQIGKVYPTQFVWHERLEISFLFWYVLKLAVIQELLIHHAVELF